jgi:hypothetical protein
VAERLIPSLQADLGAGATVEVAQASTQGFRLKVRSNSSGLEEVEVDFWPAAPKRGPPLGLRAKGLAQGPPFSLRKYSLRSARYIFLWFAIHAGAVLPIIFFVQDPLGLRRWPDPSGGLIVSLGLVAPLLALVAAAVAVLLLTVRFGWKSVAVVTDRQGRATGNSWTAKGELGAARRVVADPAVLRTLESRGVVGLEVTGGGLTLAAQGPRVNLSLAPGEEGLVQEGYGREVVEGVERKVATAMAAQLADLLALTRRLAEILAEGVTAAR